MKQFFLISFILSVLLSAPAFVCRAPESSCLAPESEFFDLFGAEEMGLEGMVMVLLTMPGMREEVIEDLIDYGEGIQRVIPALAEALSFDDDRLHFDLLYLFSELGENAAAAVPELIQFIKKNKGKKVDQAVKVLAKVGRSQSGIVETLLRELKPAPAQSMSFEDAISATSLKFKPSTVIMMRRKDLRLARLMMWALIRTGTKESVEAARKHLRGYEFNLIERNGFIRAIKKQELRLAGKKKHPVQIATVQDFELSL